MSFSFRRCGIYSFHEVLGIDTDRIRSYWELHSEDENSTQTAYPAELSNYRNFWLIAFGLWPDCWRPATQYSMCARGRLPLNSTSSLARNRLGPKRQRVAKSHRESFTAYPHSDCLLPPYSVSQTHAAQQFDLFVHILKTSETARKVSGYKIMAIGLYIYEEC